MHPSAVVDAEAELGEEVAVGALAVVEAGARIGARSRLGARSVVEQSAQLGEDCQLGAGAMVMAGCRLGDRVRVGAGAVVGSEGFGFTFGEGGPQRIPQRGIVVLEDDVEIGALAAVDRATLGETLLRRGVKVDNLVQIGHNVVIREGTVVAAQTGIAGSSKVGAGVLMGGQTGVGDHVVVGDGARLAGRSGVTADVPPGSTMAGYPAIPHAEWLRVWSWLRRAADRRRG